MTLYGRNGEIIGSIQDSGGNQVAYDRNGSIVGTYYPDSNQTYDRYGSIAGTGNLLSMLLKDE